MLARALVKERKQWVAGVVTIIFRGCMQGLEQTWDFRGYRMRLRVIVRTQQEEITGFLSVDVNVVQLASFVLFWRVHQVCYYVTAVRSSGL